MGSCATTSSSPDMEVLGWLYVQDERVSLTLKDDAIRVNRPDQPPLSLPLMAIGGIVTFGAISVSPWLIQRCAADGRPLVLMQRSGRFGARVEGPCHGNVVLRQAQYRAADDRSRALEIARAIVAGKVQASRRVLQRGSRETTGTRAAKLDKAADSLADLLPLIQAAGDVAELLGYEGAGGAAYFGAFSALLPDGWAFDRRQRRPPRDPVNAMLSFLYSIVRNEVVNALEATGLDPQIGYLHGVRPGRPALALDLQEEFRAPLADRLVLSLLNRKQVAPSDFKEEMGGSVILEQRAREAVLGA